MGKAARKAKSVPKPIRKRGHAKTVIVRPSRKLSAEQLRRYDELRAHLRQWMEEAESMTPAERAQADAEWELFKKSMNQERERVGAPPLYRD